MNQIDRPPLPGSINGRKEDLADVILPLFSHSGQAAMDDRELEAFMSSLIQGFLQTEMVRTGNGSGPNASTTTGSQIPLEPSSLAQYLEFLSTDVVPYSIHTSSPRCLSNMTPPSPRFVHSIGRLLLAMNQNMVKLEASGVLSLYERQALAMLHRLIFQHPDDFYRRHSQHSDSTLGMVVSGGTLANITALWCARNRALGPSDGFAGVEVEGLPAALDYYAYEGAVIISSTAAHYSVAKAVGLLGIGERHLLQVPVDRDDRMSLDALRQAVAMCRDRRWRVLAIVGVAGSTESGAIDPLDDIATVAREENAHFHVDAAWGGPLLFSEAHRHRLAGIAQADSVTIDGHKQLYLPVGTGMVLLRDPAMARVIEKQAHYVVRQDSHDLGRRSLEGTRPAMSLYLHAALNVIGQRGYAFLIEDSIRKARYLAGCIEGRPEFELLLDPPMNILLYRYLPEPFRDRAARHALTDADNRSINQANVALHEAQFQLGNFVVGRTTLFPSPYGRSQPVVALRAVIANPLTTTRHLDDLLCEQVELAEHLE